MATSNASGRALPSILSPRGDDALAELLRREPLMAFDFDGTLAPIVAHPDAACTPPTVSALMRALASHLPVAVITGRAVEDVRRRLGFDPHFIIGNHGAEDEEHGGSPEPAAVLNELRKLLQTRSTVLSTVGILVEDKGQSIALHYRLAPDPLLAQAVIHDLLSTCQGTLRVFGGRMVVNVMGADAPDKAQAVQRLVRRCGAQSVFYAGDDLNDEPVFEAAQAHWVTVRVSPQGDTRARFMLEETRHMKALLERILALHACLHTLSP